MSWDPNLEEWAKFPVWVSWGAFSSVCTSWFNSTRFPSTCCFLNVLLIYYTGYNVGVASPVTHSECADPGQPHPRKCPIAMSQTRFIPEDKQPRSLDISFSTFKEIPRIVSEVVRSRKTPRIRFQHRRMPGKHRTKPLIFPPKDSHNAPRETGGKHGEKWADTQLDWTQKPPHPPRTRSSHIANESLPFFPGNK